MVLLCYLLGLLILHAGLRKCESKLQSLLMVGYNYVAASALYFWIQFPEGQGAARILYVLLTSMYQAIGAVTFQGDTEVFSDPQYICICLIMAAYTIRAVLVVFLKSLLELLALDVRHFFAKEIYVVSGNEADARALIEDIHRNVLRAAVVYLPSEPQGEETEPISWTLTADERYWMGLKEKKSYHIVLLSDDFHRNIRLLRELDALGERFTRLSVTAFLDNDLIRFEDLKLEHLDAWLLSREQLAVRNFLTVLSPLKYLKERGLGEVKEGIFTPAKPFSLCIIGLDALGQEFLLSTYENTAFETAKGQGSGLKAVILDEDLEKKRAGFVRNVPRLAEESQIVWKETVYGSEAFYQALEEGIPEFHQILIATKDTEYNIDLALRLRRMFRKMGLLDNAPALVTVLYEEAGGSIALLKEEKQVFFQEMNAMQLTCRELVFKEADQQAQALHRRYLGQSAGGKEWKSLGTFTQNSNRAVVWDFPNKHLLAGDMKGLSQVEREAVYWKLARYEHRRWNAFHYARGWTVLPVEELTEEERERALTKHPEEKRHTCLVTWEELDALPQSEPGILKRYDYENVVQLLNALEPDSSNRR